MSLHQEAQLADLTVLPRAYTDFYDRFEHVVNRDVVDISKRAFSKLRVKPGDGYEGPVIVKTNANFGALPEYGAVKAAPNWSSVRSLQPTAYPIYQRRRDVPAELCVGTEKMSAAGFAAVARNASAAKGQ